MWIPVSVSVSISFPTQSAENDQHVSEDDAHGEDSGDDVPSRSKFSKNERWLSTYRPDDDEAASALAQQSAKYFSDYRPKWRKPLPPASDDFDYYNVPHSAADEDELSSGDGNSLGGNTHDQRGFGRPDSQLMKKNDRNDVSGSRSWRSNTSNTSNTSIDDGSDDDKDVYQENETKKDYDSEPNHLVDGEEQSESVYQSKHNRSKNGTKDPEVKGNKDEDYRKKKDKKKCEKKKKAKKEKKEKKKKAEDDTKKKKAKKKKKEKKKAEDDTPAVPKDNECDSSEDERCGSPTWKKRTESVNVKESNVKLWRHGKIKKAEKEKKEAEDDTPAVSKDNEYDSSEDERYGSPSWEKRATPVNVKGSNVKLWWQSD